MRFGQTASVMVLAMMATSGAIAQLPGTAAPSAVANPAAWPKLSVQRARDPRVEARVDAMLRRMSIEDKVGQLLQVDIASITPGDLETYKLGSILNGGNSAPNNDEFAPAAEWLKLFDAFYDASVKRSDKRPVVPVIWGTDAVHGANNIVGATLFPHNIGLGAMRNPALIKRIGAATAAETAATGIDWSFAPTVAVVQDDRWGRTYESYSEDPAIVESYAGQMVEGIQGAIGTAEFMKPGRVISSIKHFLADGGTGGRDQGDTRVSEDVLRDVHAAGYRSGLTAGALTVMPSFSSWYGTKMTGNQSLLTGVLKERWGFDGFTIGDWNAHGQVPGCTNEDCAAAINAGLDMFMYSGPGWKQLYDNTLRAAKAGTIPAARLDDAVRRILRVKVLAGTFEAGRPSSRPMSGKFALLGAPEHRAIARQAVRESLVLLKNNGVLPLKASANILVAGGGADNIGQQSGGWSLTWQGTGVTNANFPNGQSIFAGFAEAARAGGGKATLSVDGSFSARPDVAVVVFGEAPYAEFTGDRPTLEYSPEDKSDLALLKKLKAAGVPTVAVFLSGRPLWVNPEINAADAFVAAFLPGTEGGGVADVLMAGKNGRLANDFKGTLSFSWPRRLDQFVLNKRDANYDPLFPIGYGLTYAAPKPVAKLDETRPAASAVDQNALFVRGRVVSGARLDVAGKVQQTRIDRTAQEDSLRFAFMGEGSTSIEQAKAIDVTRESNGQLSLLVDYRVATPPKGTVTLGMTGGKTATVPITGALTPSPEWRQIAVPLRCFADGGVDMAQVTRPATIATTGALGIDVSSIRIASAPPGPVSCGVK